MIDWVKAISIHKLLSKLPVLGILAFSACSINSLAYLFLDRAQHPTPILWLAAVLVELVTAWLVWGAVGQLWKVTRSRSSKQDRRFNSIILVLYLALCLPSLATSVVANVLEFGDLLLGSLFPLLSIGCAIGAALPDTISHRDRTQASDKKAKASARAAAIKAKKAAATKEQADALAQQQVVKDKVLKGKTLATFMQYKENPTQSQASVASAIGVSRQAVGQHLAKMENAGIIKRNNGRVEVLTNLDQKE